MMAHYYGRCPDLKYLLEYEPTEIDHVLKCCGRPRLHHLLSEGLSEETLQLLNKGANVNLKDKKGQTALHVAVKNKSVSSYIVKMIAEKSSDINSKEERGKAALHLAILCDNSEALKTLLQSRANLDIEDCNGNSPLHCALPNNLDELELKNDRGKTPLHKATQAEEIRRKDKIINTMRLLLGKGANINAQNCDGETPFHLSVQNWYQGNHHELCTFLLNNGAKVDIQDKRGLTPLHYAAKYSTQICIQMLETESGITAINIPSIGGCYPLHTVVNQRDFNLVKLLLDNGAVIDSKNEDGETALHLVMEKRICNLLIERGASLNARDVNGMTPLHYATKYNNVDIIEVLIENGADVNIKNKNGKTPLHISAVLKSVNLQTFNLFLQKGATVNEQDNNGQTALHNICNNENKCCAKIDMTDYDIKQVYVKGTSKVLKLLEWGASQNIRDNFGKMPSDYCSYTTAQKQYDIKQSCLYSNCDIAKEAQHLQNGCNEEISRMKLESFGNHTLYDIFRHYDNPHFLSNKELESAVQSKDLEDKFPLYCSMLTSTYRMSKERVQLFHTVSAILSTSLPFEVMRYILSFVDNDSLWNVIKAKEEFPIKEESCSLLKSETESNSESESDWEL